MRWVFSRGIDSTMVRILFAGIVLAVVASGCASDCDVACGKLEFCQQLPGISRELCIDRCKERRDANDELTSICSDCLSNASCRTISRGSCALECRPVVGPSGSDGAGGAGGEDDDV